MSMTPEQFSKANSELRNKSPLEIVRWAIALSHARAIVSTNFRPYEAVILHLCVQVQPDIPVLWVDHGYNRPATYRHAERFQVKIEQFLQLFSVPISRRPIVAVVHPQHRNVRLHLDAQMQNDCFVRAKVGRDDSPLGGPVN